MGPGQNMVCAGIVRAGCRSGVCLCGEGGNVSTLLLGPYQDFGCLIRH